MLFHVFLQELLIQQLEDEISRLRRVERGEISEDVALEGPTTKHTGTNQPSVLMFNVKQV